MRVAAIRLSRLLFLERERVGRFVVGALDAPGHAGCYRTLLRLGSSCGSFGGGSFLSRLFGYRIQSLPRPTFGPSVLRGSY